MEAKHNANFLKFFWRQDKDWKLTVTRSSLERLAYQIVYPYLSIYIISLGATKSQLGLFTSIGMLLLGFISPFMGNIIDRTGTKKTYVLGVSLLIVCYAAYSLARSWQAAALALVLYYLGSGVSSQVCATICGNCLMNCDRAKGMTICESIAAGVLGMAGPMLGAFLLMKVSGVTGSPTEPGEVRPLFYVALGITAIALAVVAFCMSNRKWADAGDGNASILKSGITLLRGNKYARRWLVIAAIADLPAGMILPYVQVYAGEVKGAGVLTLSGMVTAAAVTSLLCGYPMGALADRIGRKKTLYIVIGLFCVSNMLYIIARSPAMLIAAGALQGFYYIGATVNASMKIELVSPDVMGTWIGLNKFVTAVAGALIALAAGIIYDRLGPQFLFIIYIAFELLVRVPLLASMPETLRKE